MLGLEDPASAKVSSHPFPDSNLRYFESKNDVFPYCVYIHSMIFEVKMSVVGEASHIHLETRAYIKHHFVKRLGFIKLNYRRCDNEMDNC